jgi:hypothetical protein
MNEIAKFINIVNIVKSEKTVFINKMYFNTSKHIIFSISSSNYYLILFIFYLFIFKSLARSLKLFPEIRNKKAINKKWLHDGLYECLWSCYELSNRFWN